MVTLSVGIGEAGTADALHLLQEIAVSEDGPAQFSPILPSTACDHIVDSGKSEALVIDVAMQHQQTS